jgi:hypothetical protein
LGKGIKAPYPITIKRRNKMAMRDKGGMAGYSAAVPKKKKNKKATSKGNAKSKADYRPGGMYSTGRAIPPAGREQNIPVVPKKNQT